MKELTFKFTITVDEYREACEVASWLDEAINLTTNYPVSPLELVGGSEE